MGISRKFHGYFKEDWRVFQWCFKWVSRVFKRSWIGVKGVSKVFQGCFKELLGVIWETIKGDSRELQGIEKKFKGVCRQVQRCFKEFQGHFKKESSVFQENFIKSFKGVSKIFKWSFFCNFVAWISSQLPEQKEGLFSPVFGLYLYLQIHKNCIL